MTGKMADDPEIPETGKKNKEMLKNGYRNIIFITKYGKLLI